MRSKVAASSLEGRRTVTGGAEDRYWRGAGQRTVTGGAEDSHWRGGGQLLEGRRTVTGMTDVPQGHRSILLPPPPPGCWVAFFCPHGNGRYKMLDSKMAAIAIAKVSNATPLLNVVHSKVWSLIYTVQAIPY